jgi:hypothetical protein
VSSSWATQAEIKIKDALKEAIGDPEVRLYAEFGLEMLS